VAFGAGDSQAREGGPQVRSRRELFPPRESPPGPRNQAQRMQSARPAERLPTRSTTRLRIPTRQETCRGRLVRGQGWKEALELLGLGQRCCFGNARAALSTPTPGRDERGAPERSAPSDACVEAASSTPPRRGLPHYPAKEA
jgi:hypothetical protein